MKKAFIDIETFSPENLGAIGTYNFAASPETIILCLAYAINDKPVKLIKLIEGEHIPTELFDPELTYVAHNIEFERTVLKGVLGWDIPKERWSCTMARAQRVSLPRSLDEVAKALRLPVRKDKDGHDAMLKLCKPKPGTKKVPATGKPWCFRKYAELYVHLYRYCPIDVEICREIDRYIPELPIREKKIWLLDREINERGVFVDVASAQAVADLVAELGETTIVECQGKYGISPTQVGEMKKRMDGKLPDMQKTTIAEALQNPDDFTEEQLELMRYRTQASLTSLTKFATFVRHAGPDHRARGMLLYYGSHTGRWTGRAVQLHNLPHGGDFDEESGNGYDPDVVFSAVRAGLEFTQMMYDNVPEVLKKCIRSVLCASPGKVLLACDFASIEARIQAWLTDSKAVLEVFRGDGKIYEHLAAQVYHVPKESIGKKSKERQVGKIIGLALQYQGALGAFRGFMKTTGFTGEMTDEEILTIVKEWRKANPNVVSYWYGLERAFKQAVRTKQVQAFRGLKIASTGTCARIYLPNGTPLTYWYPQVTSDGKLSYYGRLDGSTAWHKIDTYGGKLFENVVQAIGRELLADAMLEIDRRYPGTIVMHVHDEPVLEVDGDKGEEILADVIKIMSTPPEWGKTLPMAASGDALFRYKK